MLTATKLLMLVVDPKASAEFYRKLGLEITESLGEMTATAGSLAINCFDESRAKYKPASVQKGVGSFLYLHTDDVDRVYQRCIDNGLTPSSEPSDQPWGNREFAIKDPDGYRYVIFTPINV